MGLTAATTIRVLIKNALEQPGEAKFRSINLANEKIRERVGSIAGGITFLKAVGFVKDDATHTMTLSDEAWNEELLKHALGEIDAAIAMRRFE